MLPFRETIIGPWRDRDALEIDVARDTLGHVLEPRHDDLGGDPVFHDAGPHELVAALAHELEAMHAPAGAGGLNLVALAVDDLLADPMTVAKEHGGRHDHLGLFAGPTALVPRLLDRSLVDFVPPRGLVGGG